MTDSEKEQIKLRATYLNGIAIAVAGVGMVAPIVAVYQTLAAGTSQLTWEYMLALGVILAFTWEFSTGFHKSALRHLEKLSQAET